MEKKKVLFVNGCIREEGESRTMRLCRSVLEEYRDTEAYEIEQVNIANHGNLPFDNDRLKLRNQLIQEGKMNDSMFEQAHQFAEADIIIIGAPYWDLSFPAYVKAYIENIMVTNLTFEYIETGSRGLCHAEKLIYVTTAGGYIGDQNFGYDYVKAVARMVGIEETEDISAEGLDIEGVDEEAVMENVIEQIRKRKKE